MAVAAPVVERAPVPADGQSAQRQPDATWTLAAPTPGALNAAGTRAAPCPRPQATTGAASAVGETGATLAGTVDPESVDTTWHFEYGTGTAYGASTPDQPAGNGLDPVAASVQVAGLAPGTTYHFRLVAAGGGFTSFGADRTFTTAAASPSGGTSGGGSPGAGAGADTTPPLLALGPLRPPRARRLARSGLLVRLVDSEPGTVTATLRAGGLTLARGSAALAAAGSHTLRLRATARGAARLRRLRHGARLTATLTLVASDRAGNRRTIVRRVVLTG
jgi:hypothetical protein